MRKIFKIKFHVCKVFHTTKQPRKFSFQIKLKNNKQIMIYNAQK